VKVLYDYQGFMQRHGGVSRYFVELTAAMKALGGFEAVIPSFYTDNQYLSHKKVFLTGRPFKGKVRVMSALNKVISRRSLASSYDLFHPTYFQAYFLSYLKSPFVITVHDLIHHMYGGEYVRDDGTRLNMQTLCARAARIIAVSEATKDDLCRLVDVPDSKVGVIHHGTNLCYHGEECLHAGRYILYVGERDGYKNFSFLLSAVAPVLKSELLDLVCVGLRSFNGAEKALIKHLDVSPRVHHVQVTTSGELASLYHFASAFCYPSLHEGFGIPLIEAFSCGCPAVASAIPAFKEVSGDAAEYFDPTDPVSVRSSIQKVVLHPQKSGDLVRKGYDRVKMYTWEKAAKATVAVYQGAIG
jgi:glycosyltransferase involved in cell wall biosynthesis